MIIVDDIFRFVETEIEIRIESLNIEFDNIEEQLVKDLEKKIKIQALKTKDNIINNNESRFRLNNHHAFFKSYEVGTIRKLVLLK